MIVFRLARLQSVLSVVVIGALSGCASIVSGTDQEVMVTTSSNTGAVNGATCSLSNNQGRWTVVAPGTTRVHRSSDTLWVRCNAAGFAPQATSVSSSANGAVFGNILLGGIIGLAVDYGNGAAYTYPDRIAVDLGTPSAQTWQSGVQYAAMPGPNAPADRRPIVLNPDGSAYLQGARYVAPW